MVGAHAGNRNRPAYSGQQRFRFPKPIIELFAPRKPIQFKPPPPKRKLRPMTGLAAYVSRFNTQNQEAAAKASAKSQDQDAAPFETPIERRLRVRNEKLAKVAERVKEGRDSWDPFSKKEDAAEKTQDPFRTLFVGNVDYETLESRLWDEFETFGPVKSVVMPKDREGMPRGYAFVEFERERDLKVAYREGNGMRVDGRRLLVDVERGRTVKEWFPNRLDGPNNGVVRKSKRSGKRDKSS